MNRFSRFSRYSRRTIAKSRYTIGGYLLPHGHKQKRIYEPTYKLESDHPPSMDHVRGIIHNVLIQAIEYNMSEYNPQEVDQFTKDLSADINFRFKMQYFNRFRSIVTVNVTEKIGQGINWQMATLSEPQQDLWTVYQYETDTYIVTIFAAFIYWD